MRTTIRCLLPFLILAFFMGTAPAQEQGNLPLSKEASFVESYSPTEWNVRAAGIGTGKKKRQEANALIDARKSAVYFCLYMGTDPLLRTAEEKARFALIEQNFFDISNITKYIAWESEEYTKRVRSSDKKQLKIEKVFRVNVGLLKEDLINLGVLTATADLIAEIGMPQIMVIPEVPKGENPLEVIQNRADIKHAARSIESYLTARRYEVIVPEQQDFLNNYGETMRLVEGSSDDLSYKIALAIGSDVYITYALSIDKRMQGSTEVKKASVSVRAYETTTARLLGTETGYSYERPSPDEVVVEEAIHDAIDKVLSRINAYWKEDLQRGVQYKIVFNITGSFDEDQIEDIQFALADIVDSFATSSKENVVTDQTMDYLVWVKPKEYGKARDVYRDIRTKFGEEYANAKIRSQQMNRKLLLLEVTN